MTLLLIIVVLVLLFGGGGYGYSRWRGWPRRVPPSMRTSWNAIAISPAEPTH